MSTKSSAPYTQYANALFERAGSEQVRYPIDFLSSWSTNDPMSLGTAYYWIRLRIVTGITTSPVFQQFKLHTNRFEVNEDGAVEFFGAARAPRDLIGHIALNDPVSGSTPASSNIAFSATTTLTLTRNQFNDNSVDAFGEVIVVPIGVDTSLPIVVETGWYPDTANAGDVELEVYYTQLEYGDLWDGSEPENSIAVVETVLASTRYQSRKTVFELDISALVPGELLVIKVQRDATVGNVNDTLAGNIKFGAVHIYGYFWR